MIFRSWVWFSPPHPPTTMEIIPNIVVVGWGLVWIWVRMMNGASFCHVDIISPVGKSNPWMTSGIQECTGASPSFRARAVVISVIVIGWVSS